MAWNRQLLSTKLTHRVLKALQKERSKEETLPDTAEYRIDNSNNRHNYIMRQAAHAFGSTVPDVSTSTSTSTCYCRCCCCCCSPVVAVVVVVVIDESLNYHSLITFCRSVPTDDRQRRASRPPNGASISA